MSSMRDIAITKKIMRGTKIAINPRTCHPAETIRKSWRTIFTTFHPPVGLESDLVGTLITAMINGRIPKRNKRSRYGDSIKIIKRFLGLCRRPWLTFSPHFKRPRSALFEHCEVLAIPFLLLTNYGISKLYSQIGCICRIRINRMLHILGGC